MIPSKMSITSMNSLCELVMEGAGDAMLLVDRQGALLHFNRQATALLGCPRAEMLGMSLENLHPPEAYSRVVEAMDQLALGVHTLIEVPVSRADGTTLSVEASLSRIESPETDETFILVILRDIAFRRRAEEKRLLAERRQRDALVREVHHRIKNHLQGLLGLFEIHATRHPQSGPTFARAMTQINSMALVHGLQSERGSEDLRLCDVVAAICRSCQYTWRAGDRVELRIEAQRPLVVAADECVPIALVINELLTNALKHSRATTEPVQVTMRTINGDRGEVVITNSGELPSSFFLSAFHSLDSGLGLAQALLPAEGVDLRVEKIPGADAVRSCLTVAAPILIMNGNGENVTNE